MGKRNRECDFIEFCEKLRSSLTRHLRGSKVKCKSDRLLAIAILLQATETFFAAFNTE